jgi:hypothetical protein
MSGDDIGYIRAKLEDIASALAEIKDGKMAICQLHADALQRIESRIDVKTKGDEKKLAGISVGKWKLFGTPAVIVSVFLGIAILQYAHTLRVAETVKQEAATTAAEVAQVEVKRENRAIDRSEVASLIRDEISTAVKTYIKEHTKP